MYYSSQMSWTGRRRTLVRRVGVPFLYGWGSFLVCGAQQLSLIYVLLLTLTVAKLTGRGGSMFGLPLQSECHD